MDRDLPMRTGEVDEVAGLYSVWMQCCARAPTVKHRSELRWRARTHTELPSPTTRQEPDTDEMEPLKCKGVPMAGMFSADRALSRG